MHNTENCGHIPRNIPKTRSVEVVVGEIGKTFIMVTTMLIIKHHLIRFYSFSLVNVSSIGKALKIIPINMKICILLRPRKPPF